MSILYTRVRGIEENKISDLILFSLFSLPTAKLKCVLILESCYGVPKAVKLTVVVPPNPEIILITFIRLLQITSYL